MKVFLILVLGLASTYGAPKSSKLQFTPLHSGGGRIVGGTDAGKGEFPHQIQLLQHNSLICGGSIHSNHFVITAGHCCDGMSASQLSIKAGKIKLHGHEAGEQHINVKHITLHEDYDSWTVENDICLLRLESNLELNDNTAAIAMPSQNEEYTEGTDCIVTGWGTTSEGGSLAHTLQKVTVPVVSDDNCRSAYGQSDIADSMICAGLDAGGKDSCQGDSGGPMICGMDTQLSGIVSWGQGCAEPGYPGVYTQTSYFSDWVKAHSKH